MIFWLTVSAGDIVVAQEDFRTWVSDTEVVEPLEVIEERLGKSNGWFISLVGPVVDVVGPRLWVSGGVEDVAFCFIAVEEMDHAEGCHVAVDDVCQDAGIHDETEAALAVFDKSFECLCWIMVGAFVVALFVEGLEVLLGRVGVAVGGGAVDENALKVVAGLLIDIAGIDGGLNRGEDGWYVSVSTHVGAADPSGDGCQVTIEVKSCCCCHSNSLLIYFVLVFPAVGESLERTEVDVAVFVKELCEDQDFFTCHLEFFDGCVV